MHASEVVHLMTIGLLELLPLLYHYSLQITYHDYNPICIAARITAKRTPCTWRCSELAVRAARQQGAAAAAAPSTITTVLTTFAQPSHDTLHNIHRCLQDCYTDFRLAPGGAASWLYVLHGSKVLLLLPPSQRNRRLFLTWSAVTRAAQGKENLVAECFLADYAEGAVRVEVRFVLYCGRGLCGVVSLCAFRTAVCKCGCF
jgi:hypothetical protein